MSKEQAKGFFEAISKDNQLAEQVNAVMGGQATNQEKAKELLSLAKAHNFNFTEDELKRSLSREDLADIAGGGVLSLLGSIAAGMLQMLGIGGNGGQQPLPAPNPIVNVQQVAGNAQNEGEQLEDEENEILTPVYDDYEQTEIRELTEEEIAARQQQEEQRRREREARLAQGPLELDDDQPYFDGYSDNYGDLLAEAAREADKENLQNRINRLEELSARLKPYLDDNWLRRVNSRIQDFIHTVDFNAPSLKEQILLSDNLIRAAEAVMPLTELRHRDAVFYAIEWFTRLMTHLDSGLPTVISQLVDIDRYLAKPHKLSIKKQIRNVREFFDNTLATLEQLPDFKDFEGGITKIQLNELLKSASQKPEDEQLAILMDALEFKVRPWFARIVDHYIAPGYSDLVCPIDRYPRNRHQYVTARIKQADDLLNRVREIMMKKARAYTRFDVDQKHIHSNDLQLARKLGIDKEYIQEKIKNKTVASREDIEGSIELPDGGEVAFRFFFGSGTLVLTGSGNTTIGSRYKDDSLWQQLEKAGIVFKVKDVKQLLTPDRPFVVHNLIIGNGITQIDSSAFSSAEELRSVYFMGPVQSIHWDAFSHNGKLVEVGFAQPDKLVYIGDAAFLSCNNLASINLPQKTNIHEDAFAWCTHLNSQGYIVYESDYREEVR